MTTAEDTLVMTRTPLGNGVVLESVEQRAPHGTPVLLHGVTDSWRSFERVLPHLPRSLRAIAITQRGHGHSSRPEGGYGYADLAGDLAAFMDARGIPAAVVVGHSMGGLIAQRFAAEHPERTLGLVLIGSFHTLTGHPGVLELLDTAIEGMTDPVDPEFVRAFQESTVATPIARALMDTFVAESLKVPARVWQALFTGFAAADGAADLARITAPTLVVSGGNDTFSRRQERDALLAGIRGAVASDYPDAGHAVHWEHPAAVARDIARFASWIAAAPTETHRG